MLNIKKISIAIVCLLAALFFTSCNRNSTYPMFWTWLDYHEGVNFDSLCQVMQDAGIDGVMLNAPSPDDYRKAIPLAHKHGITVYAWLWTMNLEHGRDSIVKVHPEWLCVNRKGQSLADTTAYVDYYKFLCPALPEVRQYILGKIEDYCNIDGLDGIVIDYHRMVDVVLPTTLWDNYGIKQDREYAEWDYGYHPDMIRIFKEKYGYDPRDQKDPSLDEKWRQFRCDQISEVANLIAETVHKYGKKMAASPFPTPKMASRMVRQDWSRWNLDIVFPMVYHNFYTEDVNFISDCMIEDVRDKQPQTTLYCGIMADNTNDLFAAMHNAFDSGAQGIAIFTVNDLKTPEMIKRFREFTEIWRKRRKHSGKIEPIITAQKADTDLMTHYGLMEKIIHKACKLKNISYTDDNNPLHFSAADMKLIESYDAHKKYLVFPNDKNRSFILNIYLYGDVISGWSVENNE